MSSRNSKAKGVIVLIITPIDPQGNIDISAFKALIDHVVNLADWTLLSLTRKRRIQILRNKQNIKGFQMAATYYSEPFYRAFATNLLSATGGLFY